VIRKVYSDSKFQSCLTHATRNILLKVRVKNRKEISQDLKRYTRPKIRDRQGKD
jgi:transposase-like protein